MKTHFPNTYLIVCLDMKLAKWFETVYDDNEIEQTIVMCQVKQVLFNTALQWTTCYMDY